MNDILDKLKNTRILAAIGIAGLILGTIFSYVSYTIWGYTYHISLWNYLEGKIILIIAVANLLFIFKDLVEKYIPSLFNTGIGKKIAEINSPKASLIPTIIAAGFALYLTIKLDVEFSRYSLGFYVLWIGVICLVAYAILHKNDNVLKADMEDNKE